MCQVNKWLAAKNKQKPGLLENNRSLKSDQKIPLENQRPPSIWKHIIQFLSIQFQGRMMLKLQLPLKQSHTFPGLFLTQTRVHLWFLPKLSTRIHWCLVKRYWYATYPICLLPISERYTVCGGKPQWTKRKWCVSVMGWN